MRRLTSPFESPSACRLRVFQINATAHHTCRPDEATAPPRTAMRLMKQGGLANVHVRANERALAPPKQQTNPKDRPKQKPMTIPKGRAKQQVLVTQSSGGLLDVPHDKVSCYCHKTIARSLRNRDSPPQSKRTRRAPRGEHAPLEASEANNAASLRATIRIADANAIILHDHACPSSSSTQVSDARGLRLRPRFRLSDARRSRFPSLQLPSCNASAYV